MNSFDFLMLLANPILEPEEREVEAVMLKEQSSLSLKPAQRALLFQADGFSLGPGE